MEVAVRKPSKGPSIALWRHEFYAVFSSNPRLKGGKKEVDIYQALEFRKGTELPQEFAEGLSEKQRTDIWVQGVYYAPAAIIMRANTGLRKDRYIFQKDNVEGWEPCPQYKAALGKCPELVRLENCKCWIAMSEVLHMLPRVVHPADVQTQDMYVNGRDWHYVCGVIATELINPPCDKGRVTSLKDGFRLKMLDRKLSIMYPEERLGGFINSASAQWQVIDALFQGMRDVMSSGTAYTSGTFSIAWTNSCQKFWEVTVPSHYPAPRTQHPAPNTPLASLKTNVMTPCAGTHHTRLNQKDKKRGT